MKQYETIFITDPDLSEEDRDQLFERTKGLISSQGGFLVKFDEWGARKLAYDIKKKNRGYYVRLDYCGDGPLVGEMERNFRIDDRVLKFMTILLERDVNLEEIKEALAVEEEEAAAKYKASYQEENMSDSPEVEDKEVEDKEVENKEVENKDVEKKDVVKKDVEDSNTEDIDTEDTRNDSTETKISEEE
jgi:small subunit ribosomal protein S6